MNIKIKALGGLCVNGLSDQVIDAQVSNVCYQSHDMNGAFSSEETFDAIITCVIIGLSSCVG